MKNIFNNIKILFGGKVYRQYHENGQLRVKCTYKNWKKDGPYEEYYYKNGRLKIKCTYKDGKIDGPYERYDEDGRLEIKCTYKDGKKDGPYKSYHPNGQLWEKCTYKDGRIDGPFELYWENGVLLIKRTYKDGKKDGPYEEYATNGQLEMKCTYKDGKEDGPYESYWGNGQLLKKAIYKMGQELSGQEAKDYLKQWEQEQAEKQKQTEDERLEKIIDSKLGGLKEKLKQLEDKEEIKKKLTARTPERLEKAAEIKQMRLAKDVIVKVGKKIVAEGDEDVKRAFGKLIYPYAKRERRMINEQRGERYERKLARQRREKGK